MDRADISELHYITAIANLPSILQHGILSHQRAEQFPHYSVAMPEVQEISQNRDAQPSESEVLQAVMQWKQKRRPPLDEVTVASTIRNLGMLRWLKVKPSPELPLPEEEALAA